MCEQGEIKMEKNSTPQIQPRKNYKLTLKNTTNTPKILKYLAPHLLYI